MPRFAIYYIPYIIFTYISREKTNRMRFMFFSFPFSTFCTQNTHINDKNKKKIYHINTNNKHSGQKCCVKWLQKKKNKNKHI